LTGDLPTVGGTGSPGAVEVDVAGRVAVRERHAVGYLYLIGGSSIGTGSSYRPSAHCYSSCYVHPTANVAYGSSHIHLTREIILPGCDSVSGYRQRVYI